jgi:hypothetical protein
MSLAFFAIEWCHTVSIGLPDGEKSVTKSPIPYSKNRRMEGFTYATALDRNMGYRAY